jgi:molecular chaperone GrpE
MDAHRVEPETLESPLSDVPLADAPASSPLDPSSDEADVTALATENGDAAPDLNAQMLALEAERQHLREELLRSMADIDNLRKRSMRETEDARKYAVTQFARDVLSVSDNLERALSALPPQSEDAHIKTVIEGVALVQQEMVSLLGRHQIHKISALHQKFDPHLHQAMLEIDSTEHAPGTVMQVLQEGYTLGERLLRPALVGVAKKSSPPAV